MIGERVAPCFLFFGVGHSAFSWRRQGLNHAARCAGQCSFITARLRGEGGVSILNELNGSRRDYGAGRTTVGANRSSAPGPIVAALKGARSGGARDYSELCSSECG